LPARRRSTKSRICADWWAVDFGVALRAPRNLKRRYRVKILAVEDDAVARAVLKKALQRLGHEVLLAADGEAAWALVQQDPVRVVVSDWMMPEVDGLELCRRIRHRVGVEYVYFILVTARDATEDNRAAAADAGVDDFLTKPLDVSELWTRLRVAERILRSTTQVRELEELLPICSYCKKIRDDQNYWQQLEGYISERTGSDFSHSVCPDCYQRVVLPELEKLKSTPSRSTKTPFSVERKP
jgi:sigma-B regulation protein RsbU (phosphoserine phosphatase)